MRLLHNIVMVLIMALVMVLSLSGCASLPTEQRAASDPWEAMNRPLFRVNVGADSVITKPLAKGYRAIMPGAHRLFAMRSWYRSIYSRTPNITLRESYLQNRQYEIYDGDPPLDEDFLDEFLEAEY